MVSESGVKNNTTNEWSDKKQRFEMKSFLLHSEKILRRTAFSFFVVT